MSKIDLVVLGFLKREPMHGYKMAGFLEKHGIDMWVKLKKPSVYKALTRLEKRSYISFKYEQAENTPPKKVYHITNKGVKYFEKLLIDILSDSKSTTPFDFWNVLRFAEGNISKDKFINIIEHRLNIIENREIEMQKKHAKAQSEGEFENIPYYFNIVMSSMGKIKEIVKSSLKEIKDKANLPENAGVFKKEQ